MEETLARAYEKLLQNVGLLNPLKNFEISEVRKYYK